MRDFDLTPKDFSPKEQTELQIQKKQQIERELIGKIIPHNGHIVWEINIETDEIQKAMYIKSDFVFGFNKKHNTEVLYREGFAYVSAMNKKNALKKYRNGKNGSKEVVKNPLTIQPF